MHRKFLAIMLLAGALVTAGCDNEVENATGPAPPNPTTTDTFTGTINVNGAQTHTFPVVASGPVTLTLAEVLPDPAIAVGLTLGTWNGTCLCVRDRQRQRHSGERGHRRRHRRRHSVRPDPRRWQTDRVARLPADSSAPVDSMNYEL